MSRSRRTASIQGTGGIRPLLLSPDNPNRISRSPPGSSHSRSPPPKISPWHTSWDNDDEAALLSDSYKARRSSRHSLARILASPLAFSPKLVTLLIVSFLAVIMYIRQSSFTMAAVAALWATSAAAAGTTLDGWLNNEYPLAQTEILRNIAPGDHASDGATGVVVASPSTNHPNYYYQWVRDAALTYQTVIDDYIAGKTSNDQQIRGYIDSSQTVQHVSNPSGDYYSGGLGEPKFYLNNTAFQGSWGRPQNDGPGLRATALGKYLTNYLAGSGSKDQNFINKLYQGDLSKQSIIKSDLEYVAHHWQDQSFDLWEEVKGTHFFTLMVQLRSMVEGATLADKFNDGGASSYYRQQASSITSQLQQFWNAQQNHLIETLNTQRSGLDCALLLGAIHGPTSGSPFSPGSDKILASHYAIQESFRSLYKINSGSSAPSGYVGIGRYPEDIYDGYDTSRGNPWYLCNAAAAEVLYSAVTELDGAGSVKVTNVTSAFWSQFGSYKTGAQVSKSSNKQAFTTLLQSVRQHADQLMQVVQDHAANNGSLAEEFNRDNGYAQGARDLTWSYASIRTATQARNAAKALGY
ncbi:glycoside hydrolase 15 protein [Savitreella phatthalungensis]